MIVANLYQGGDLCLWDPESEDMWFDDVLDAHEFCTDSSKIKQPVTPRMADFARRIENRFVSDSADGELAAWFHDYTSQVESHRKAVLTVRLPEHHYRTAYIAVVEAAQQAGLMAVSWRLHALYHPNGKVKFDGLNPRFEDWQQVKPRYRDAIKPPWSDRDFAKVCLEPLQLLLEDYGFRPLPGESGIYRHGFDAGHTDLYLQAQHSEGRGWDIHLKIVVDIPQARAILARVFPDLPTSDHIYQYSQELMPRERSHGISDLFRLHLFWEAFQSDVIGQLVRLRTLPSVDHVLNGEEEEKIQAERTRRLEQGTPALLHGLVVAALAGSPVFHRLADKLESFCQTSTHPRAVDTGHRIRPLEAWLRANVTPVKAWSIHVFPLNSLAPRERQLNFVLNTLYLFIMRRRLCRGEEEKISAFAKQLRLDLSDLGRRMYFSNVMEGVEREQLLFPLSSATTTITCPDQDVEALLPTIAMAACAAGLYCHIRHGWKHTVILPDGAVFPPEEASYWEDFQEARRQRCNLPERFDQCHELAMELLLARLACHGFVLNREERSVDRHLPQMQQRLYLDFVGEGYPSYTLNPIIRVIHPDCLAVFNQLPDLNKGGGNLPYHGHAVLNETPETLFGWGEGELRVSNRDALATTLDRVVAALLPFLDGTTTIQSLNQAINGDAWPRLKASLRKRCDQDIFMSLIVGRMEGATRFEKLEKELLQAGKKAQVGLSRGIKDTFLRNWEQLRDHLLNQVEPLP